MEYFLSILIFLEIIIIGSIIYISIKKRNKILISIQRNRKTLSNLQEKVQERIKLITEQRDTIFDLNEETALLNNELRTKMEYLKNIKNKETGGILNNY